MNVLQESRISPRPHPRQVELTDVTNNGDPFSFANLTTTSITLDPLVQDHVYEVRVRAFNVVGAGEWTDPQRVFTFRDGECADDANAEVKKPPAIAVCCDAS